MATTNYENILLSYFLDQQNNKKKVLKTDFNEVFIYLFVCRNCFTYFEITKIAITKIHEHFLILSAVFF